jgi:hypothetical protein
MRSVRPLRRWSAITAIAGWALFALPGPAAALPADLISLPPSAISVTVYRAPSRGSGSINLDYLNGFALISETRTVHLPAGTSRLRFEGVADGIEPASAIISGLPGGVIEKNRDARLLSPSSLIAAAVGKPVELLRSNRKTGKTERLPGTILSNSEGGVVFKTAQGIEALRCSGLPETFSFDSAQGLSPSPTLSVLVRSNQALTRQVTLSYLAHGFDWAADYTATLSADGKTVDLGAWVTLANSNGVGFPDAHTQIVAGRINREDGALDPIDAGGPILAQCWPRGSTSDSPAILMMAGASAVNGIPSDARARMQVMPMAAAALREEAKAVTVTQEQLGDLKLYRVPDRTTIASRQSKQVRLMDRAGIPVSIVYGADLAPGEIMGWAPAHKLLRTTNIAANHLGLPLPSGTVAVFTLRDGQRLLLNEAGLRDTAVAEEVEINLGSSADVQVSLSKESSSVDTEHAEMLPLVPGVSALRAVKVDDICRVEIRNARSTPVPFELRLQLPADAGIVRADHPLGLKNGRPLFRLTLPANDSAIVRFQTQHFRTTAVKVR